MARTPNYSFERMERERQKAIKANEKAEAKREQRDAERGAQMNNGPKTNDDA